MCQNSWEIYLAGVDTSAITIIWAMAELITNPRVMKKTQDEIRTCIGIKQNGRIEEEDTHKLHYLKLVIKETLRLHPAAPLLLPRETMADIKIQGYDIPCKTLLLINAWSIGRNPKLWRNPEEFNPDRFIDCPIDYKGNNFEMLPFGSGRKICPGMAFGIATIELTLLNLLYFFDWRLPGESKDIDMEEAGDTTIVKKVPLELIPVPYH
ncbi:PREDICTED: cytochrome P450 71B3-like [Camelina sativa]|uniref:Cytochrome P450 71B3-like n=1 Tax=Camelina sativa TaxID=90675 RepID=A0ABM1QF62_CAMSA|nr:PREDICTED: cytochrome P450 71B3-like [Camelina sativa]